MKAIIIESGEHGNNYGVISVHRDPKDWARVLGFDDFTVTECYYKSRDRKIPLTVIRKKNSQMDFYSENGPASNDTKLSIELSNRSEDITGSVLVLGPLPRMNGDTGHGLPQSLSRKRRNELISRYFQDGPVAHRRVLNPNYVSTSKRPNWFTPFENWPKVDTWHEFLEQDVMSRNMTGIHKTNDWHINPIDGMIYVGRVMTVYEPHPVELSRGFTWDYDGVHRICHAHEDICDI